ncbi:hypothetical protein [Methylocystis iwaonis]|uniref:Uncharacterized protein n=1 Tax=Methylocystis iwaonis TaxID=2885079 RepID=A0ABM8EBD0_9HYPH|nr:hypothetical protein SS37A_28080 [Methylocystis iwaonis]
MVAGNRQAGDHYFGLGFRRDLAGRQRVTDNAVAFFRINGAVIEADAGAARAAALRRLAEALDNIRCAVAVLILKRNEEAALMRLSPLPVIAPAPCIDVNDAVVGDGDVAGVADLIGEDRGAETRGQRYAGVAAGAGRLVLALRGARAKRRERRQNGQGDCTEQSSTHRRLIGFHAEKFARCATSFRATLACG